MKIAIYSRKSKFTGKGESVENQVQMCKDYAKRHFEDVKDIYIYEDEGFSGGNTNRPEFKRMMKDAKNKKFDVLICYRLDRVSRDVADFSTMIDALQEYDIDFVSVREQFDTSTPMGRAMMYIASVFAQLERETIAERIKDNMLQLATTGRWLGGNTPLGFESERISYVDKEFKERSLVVLTPVPEELKLVELFFDKYLELRSVYKVMRFAAKSGIKTKNNARYSSKVLSSILRNTVYVKANNAVVEYLENKGIEVAGKERIDGVKSILIYNKRDGNRTINKKEEWIAAVAKHDGCIDAEKWLKVQHLLDKNNKETPRTGTSEIALLSGIIRCAKCGGPMRVMYGTKRKDGTMPHYYVCSAKSIMKECQNENINGADIEHTVIKKLIELSSSKEVLLQELETLREKNKPNDMINALDELKSKRKELLRQINNLVGEVSKSPVASKYILPQIETRDEEVKNLNEKINKLEKEQKASKKDIKNLDLVVNNILNFKNAINRLSNKEKKYFLKTIVYKVYWNGDTGEVTIKLLSGSSNVSQFQNSSSSN